LALALTGAGLLRLGDRIPDPLLQAQRSAPQAVKVADSSRACTHPGSPHPLPLGNKTHHSTP